MPVSVTEMASAKSSYQTIGVPSLPPSESSCISNRDAALLRKFKGIGKQVLQNLLQSLFVCIDHDVGNFIVYPYVKLKAFVTGDRLKLRSIKSVIVR